MAKPRRQHILKTLKISTRWFVDSFVSRISSSRFRIMAKVWTIESDRSSRRFRSISSGFNLAASPYWKDVQTGLDDEGNRKLQLIEA